MKFYRYINEGNRYPEEYEDIKSILIKKNSKPFLKEFGKMYGSNKYIYRGYDAGQKTMGYILKKSRTNRKPRFLPQDVHKHLSKLSKKLWGWDMRTEGVFTGDDTNASNFGQLWRFIPIGNYKYIYTTEISDIYSIYDNYKLSNDEEKKVLIDKLDDLYKTEYETKNLSSILRSRVEFESIFKCKEYILVRHPQLYKIIVEVMKHYNLA